MKYTTRVRIYGTPQNRQTLARITILSDNLLSEQEAPPPKPPSTMRMGRPGPITSWQDSFRSNKANSCPQALSCSEDSTGLRCTNPTLACAISHTPPDVVWAGIDSRYVAHKAQKHLRFCLETVQYIFAI